MEFRVNRAIGLDGPDGPDGDQKIQLVELNHKTKEFSKQEFDTGRSFVMCKMYDGCEGDTYFIGDEEQRFDEEEIDEIVPRFFDLMMEQIFRDEFISTGYVIDIRKNLEELRANPSVPIRHGDYVHFYSPDKYLFIRIHLDDVVNIWLDDRDKPNGKRFIELKTCDGIIGRLLRELGKVSTKQLLDVVYQALVDMY